MTASRSAWLVVALACGGGRSEIWLPRGLLQFGWTNSVHPACLPYSTFGTCQTSYAQLGGIGTRSLRSP